MEIKYDLVVDFARANKSNTIIISENDINSRTLHFILLDNKQPMGMSDVVLASIQGIRKDGSAVIGTDLEIMTDDDGNKINELKYTIPKEITQIAGTITMTISLSSETGQMLTSPEIYVVIRNQLYNEDDYVSEDDYVGFRALLNRCMAAVEKIENLSLNDTLPNPYPLNITIEDDDYTYTGRESVEIALENICHVSEDLALEVDYLDASSTQNAAASADEAKESELKAAQYAVNAKASETASAASASAADLAKVASQNSSDAAGSYSNIAKELMLKAEGYAVGTQNGENVGSDSPYYHNNAKYFVEGYSVIDNLESTDPGRPLSANMGRVLNDTKQNKLTAGDNITIVGDTISAGGASDYSELENKPSINGVELSGNKTSSDLSIASVASVNAVGQRIDEYEQLGWTSPNELIGMNYLDSNGIFHQKIGRLYMGDLNWAYNTGGFMQVSIPSDVKKSSNPLTSSTICPHTLVSTTSSYLRVYGSGYTDASAFISYLQSNDIYLYYELGTEVTRSVDSNEIASVLQSDINAVNTRIDEYEQSGYLGNNILSGYAYKNVGSDGTIGASSGSQFVSMIDKQSIKPNSDITISSDASVGGGGIDVYIGRWGSNGTWISRTNIGSLSNGQLSYHIPSDTYAIFVFLFASSSITATYLQIEYGTRTKYVPSNTELQSQLEKQQTTVQINTATSSVTTNYIAKTGSFVNLSMNFITSASTNAYTAVAVVPEGYRPIVNQALIIRVGNSFVIGAVEYTGGIKAYTGAIPQGSVSFAISYII